MLPLLQFRNTYPWSQKENKLLTRYTLFIYDIEIFWDWILAFSKIVSNDYQNEQKHF